MFTFRDEACEDLSTLGGQLPQPTKRHAAADNASIGDEYFSHGDQGVTTVGLTKCGLTWVVGVGVSDQSVTLPRFGPNGTAVMVYEQPGFYASVS